MTINGTLTNWEANDRLDYPWMRQEGYEVYGKVTDGKFVFALHAPAAIGAGTTIWLNTDHDPTTGHQIFDWAGGAEFNVNFGADGLPYLYTGADGGTQVGTFPLVHNISINI